MHYIETGFDGNSKCQTVQNKWFTNVIPVLVNISIDSWDYNKTFIY